ncbi:MAG: methyl-accepting chemotaxis protein [Selenomonadaceae bacterium]|nr:methyl-accepting chemotaxis protein [Selenomonadaceae bacterium]
MDNLTIKQKLFFVFILLIAAFIGNGIYSAFSLSSINDGALRIATQHLQGVISASESSKAMSDYRQGEYTVIDATTLPNRIFAAQQTKKLADQIDITFDAIQPSLEGEIAKEFSDMRTTWNQYKENSNKVIELAKQGNVAEARKLVENSIDKYTDIGVKLNKILDNRKDFIHEEVVDSAAKYNQTKIILIISILIVVLFSVFMAVALTKSILNSIEYLSGVSKELADGNLTVEAKAQTNDEFGHLTEIYANTIEKLRALIENIQHNAKDASNFASQLNENATQSALATQQVAASIGNVADNANKQGVAVEQSTQAIRAFAELLQKFEEKANSSVTSAKNVEEIAESGRAAVRGAVDQMSAVAESVANSAKVINQLAERSAQIGNISSTIASIAEQTNLLALNAAIEAARAGEHGRGFAVVSDEVRKLAEGSNVAASQIAKLITSIQEEMKEALEQMERGNQEVESGKVVVAAAGDSFRNINSAISQLTDHSEEILRNAQDALTKVDKIVETMDELNKSSKDVSAETESVSAATEEQSASIDEVAGASQKLSELAEALTESTAKFKIFKGADRVKNAIEEAN